MSDCVWVRTLLLLGYTSFIEREKVRYPSMKDNFEVSETMFHRNNESGLMAIIYFLFTTLDDHQYSKLFRHAWPLLDTTTRKEFRKVAMDALKKLEDADKLPRGSSRPSLLQSPIGPRVEDLCWHLSTFVIHSILSSSPSYSNGGPSLCLRMPDFSLQSTAPSAANNARGSIFAQLTTTEALLLMQSRTFRRQAEKMVHTQNMWKAFGLELSKVYRCQVDELRSLKARIEAVVGGEEARVFRDSGGEIREAQVASIKVGWKKVDEFAMSDSITQGRRTVSEVQDRSRQSRLETRLEVREGEVPPAYKAEGSGKVDLTGLVTKWAKSMKEMRATITMGETPSHVVLPPDATNGKDLINVVKLKHDQHCQHLESLHILSTRATDMVREIKESIEGIKKSRYDKQLQSAESCSSPCGSEEVTDTRMNITAPTPLHTYVPRRNRLLDTPGGAVPPTPGQLFGNDLRGHSRGGANIEASVKKKATKATARLRQPLLAVTPVSTIKGNRGVAAATHTNSKLALKDYKASSTTITKQAKPAPAVETEGATVRKLRFADEIVVGNATGSKSQSASSPPVSTVSVHRGVRVSIIDEDDDRINMMAQKLASHMLGGEEDDLDDVHGFITRSKVANTPIQAKSAAWYSANSKVVEESPLVSAKSPTLYANVQHSSNKENEPQLRIDVTYNSPLDTATRSGSSFFDMLSESPLVGDDDCFDVIDFLQ